jgi:hypothetical protein
MRRDDLGARESWRGCRKTTLRGEGSEGKRVAEECDVGERSKLINPKPDRVR